MILTKKHNKTKSQEDSQIQKFSKKALITWNGGTQTRDPRVVKALKNPWLSLGSLFCAGLCWPVSGAGLLRLPLCMDSWWSLCIVSSTFQKMGTQGWHQRPLSSAGTILAPKGPPVQVSVLKIQGWDTRWEFRALFSDLCLSPGSLPSAFSVHVLQVYTGKVWIRWSLDTDPCPFLVHESSWKTQFSLGNGSVKQPRIR